MKPSPVKNLITERKKTGCWIWNGSKNEHGYGHVWYKPFKRKIGAHRLVYLILIGKIPKRKWLLHKCDNPPCVNPKHLWLGNAQDNVDDKMKKNRHYQKNQTHCRSGHPLFGPNLYTSKKGRHCRICVRNAGRKYDKSHKRAALIKKYKRKGWPSSHQASPESRER